MLTNDAGSEVQVWTVKPRKEHKMRQHYYEASILINGRTITEYWHDGQVYIEGRKGSEFQLRLRNNSSKRILVIASVDGLSVMDGNPASEESRGYIVTGYSTLDIPGWRLNNDQVAKFVFSGKTQAYAEQMQKGGQCGVIGFMIFEELVPPTAVYYPNFITCSTAPPQWSSNTSASVEYQSSNQHTIRTADSFELGTGFGQAQQHSVSTATFRRKSTVPDAIMVMYYDSRRNLEKRGIIMTKQSQTNLQPNPFPGSQQYCQPPMNWRP